MRALKIELLLCKLEGTTGTRGLGWIYCLLVPGTTAESCDQPETFVLPQYCIFYSSCEYEKMVCVGRDPKARLVPPDQAAHGPTEPFQ